jgi:succinate semialdehyde reductase (NADPH)
MKAAVLHAPWDLRIEELRDPAPGPGEVLVRVAACGVCRSDLHQVRGALPVALPRVLGHEIAGTVVAVGEGVETPEVGADVVAPFIMVCGACPECERGRDDFCERFWTLNRGQGVLFDGTTRLWDLDGEPIWMDAMSGYAELSVVPATSVFPAPSGHALAGLAPLGCAFFTAFGAARHAAQLQVGESVAVVGVGGVGSSLVQICRAMGAAMIVAIDVSTDKLAAATRLGATHTIDAAHEDVAARIAEITGKRGVNIAFEALGRPATLATAVDILSLGGRAVAIGVAGAGDVLPVEINPLVRRQVRVVGSYGARARRDMPDLLALVANGSISPERGISRRVALDDLPEALRALDRGEILGRAIVEM